MHVKVGFVHSWVWIVYPASFAKSMLFLLRDILTSAMHKVWKPASGRAPHNPGPQQHSAPTYEVISAKQYLQMALARRQAEGRIASLNPIRE